jgi:hypothetical protein
LHLFLEFLDQSYELVALNEEVSRPSPAILVDVRVLVASPIEELVRRGWGLFAAPAPFGLCWILIASALVAATLVGVAVSRRSITVIIVSIVGETHCHHICMAGSL